MTCSDKASIVLANIQHLTSGLLHYHQTQQFHKALELGFSQRLHEYVGNIIDRRYVLHFHLAIFNCLTDEVIV